MTVTSAGLAPRFASSSLNDVEVTLPRGLPHQVGGTGTSSLDERVRAGIATLDDMDLPALRETWRELYHTPAPKGFRRELLIRACAYQLQVEAYGGLSSRTRRELLKIAAEAEQGTFRTSGAPRRLRPGTRLVRAYDHVTHTVEVLVDGFAWNGRKYGSLSAIAKAISGTNWNGNVFFGLKTAKTAKSLASRSTADV